MEEKKERAASALPAGTLLCRRYRVAAFLRADRFGYLYEADGLGEGRMGEGAARKLLLWEWFPKGACARDADGCTVLAAGAAGVLQDEMAVLEEKLALMASIPEGIVPVRESFRENATFYYVMERPEAESVGSLASKGFLQRDFLGLGGERQLLEGLLPVLKALAGFHKKGFCHRGITADTVFLGRDGRFCLLGAGYPIRSGAREERSVHLSEAFAASEIYDIDQAQGGWTDVYAFMAVLYYILAGSPPQAIFERMFVDSLKSPREAGAKISEGLDGILMKGLSLSGKERYQDAGEVLAALQALYPGIAGAKKARPRRVFAGIALAALLFLGIAFLYFTTRQQEDIFHGEDTYVFYLYHTAQKANSRNLDLPPEEVDTEQCLSMIHERMEVLAGDEPYLWEEGEERVRVAFPAKLLGSYHAPGTKMTSGYYLGSMIRQFLLSPWVITRHGTAGAGKFFTYLPREALRGYTVQEEWEAVPESVAEVLLWEEGVRHPVLEIPLDPGQDKGFFHYTGDCGLMCRDVEDLYSFTTDLYFTLSENGSVLYVMSDAISIPLLRVVGFNLLSEPLPGYLDYILKRSRIAWEDSGKALLKGERQTDFHALRGEYALLLFPEFYDDSYARVEGFKQSLDSLRIPYAYGHSPETNELCVAFGMEEIREMPAYQARQDSLGADGDAAGAPLRFVLEALYEEGIAPKPSAAQLIDKKGEVVREEKIDDPGY